MAFFILENNNNNCFVQEKRVNSHILLSEGKVNVFFPEGNCGIWLHLNQEDNKNKNIHISYKGIPTGFIYDKKYRGVKFKCGFNLSEIVISSIYMDSVRVLRNLMDPGWIKKYTEEKEKFLSISFMPLEGYLYPEFNIEKNKKSNSIIVRHKTLDSKNSYIIKISACVSTIIENNEGKIAFKNTDNNPIELEIFAGTDFPPLIPLRENEILNSISNDYHKRIKKMNHGDLKKFDKAVTELKFLSYRGKLLAGSWRFLTFFGRDTLISAMLLKDCVNKGFYEAAIQSVLDRVSDRGEVAHEENIGCQAIYDNVLQYNALKIQNKNSEAENLKKNLSKPVYDYKMVDDDFLLPIAMLKYMEDKKITSFEKIKFFDLINLRGESNLTSLLSNFNYCLGKASNYGNNPQPENLIHIIQEKVGNWRDSSIGLGNGKYPGDVSITKVPNALKAIRNFINCGLYSYTDLAKLAEFYHFDYIEKIIKTPLIINTLINNWEKAEEYFKIHFSVDMTRNLMKKYIESLKALDEKDYYLKCEIEDNITIEDFIYFDKTPQTLKDGIKFCALSLDENGLPVKILNSDFSFKLFFENPEPDEIVDIINLLNMPFPIGLKTEVGIVAANAVYTDNPYLWKELDKDGYHGSVVWFWQNYMLEKGLMRQIKRFYGMEEHKDLVTKMIDALELLMGMEKSAGELANSEVCSFTIIGGKMKAVPWNIGVDESNPVQLWNTTVLSVMVEYDEIKKKYLQRLE